MAQLDTNKNFVTPEELKELAEKYNEEQQERIDAGDKFAKVLDIDKVLNERPDYDSWRDSYWDTERSSLEADYRIMALKELLPYMVKEKWFDSISFDNLALKQLDVKNLVPRDKWDMFYMGDEGSSTMYVDMVNREFAANSTSETRYPLLDNIEDMLKVIHQEKKEKDID